MKMQRVVLGTLLVGLVVQLSVSRAKGDVVVDFDSPNVAGTSLTGSGLDAYLSGFGISITAVTPLGYPEIHNANDHGPSSGFPNGFLTASSGTNFLSHGDGVAGGAANAPTNAPISYQLAFSSAMDSVSFTRIQINAGTSSSGAIIADWQARALDASGNTLDTVGEGTKASFATISAATFTLNGPDIHSIVIERINTNTSAGVNAVFIDDLTLVSAIPEPGTAGLVGLASLGLCFIRRRRS